MEKAESIEDALKVQQIIEAAIKSWETCRVVAV